jgi:uncharacterized protein YcfL
LERPESREELERPLRSLQQKSDRTQFRKNLANILKGTTQSSKNNRNKNKVQKLEFEEKKYVPQITKNNRTEKSLKQLEKLAILSIKNPSQKPVSLNYRNYKVPSKVIKNLPSQSSSGLLSNPSSNSK